MFGSNSAVPFVLGVLLLIGDCRAAVVNDDNADSNTNMQSPTEIASSTQFFQSNNPTQTGSELNENMEDELLQDEQIQEEYSKHHPHDSNSSKTIVFVGTGIGVAFFTIVIVAFGLAWRKTASTPQPKAEPYVTPQVLPWDPISSGTAPTPSRRNHASKPQTPNRNEMQTLQSSSSLNTTCAINSPKTDTTSQLAGVPSPMTISSQLRRHIGVRNFGVRDFEFTPSPAPTPGHDGANSGRDGSVLTPLSQDTTLFTSDSPPLEEGAVFNVAQFGLEPEECL